MPDTPSTTSTASTVFHMGSSPTAVAIKAAFVVVVVGGSIWAVNYLRDMAQANKKMAAVIDTISAEQVRLGTALTTANTLTTNQEELLKKIKAEIGKEVTEQIKRDGGKVLGLYQATGDVKETVGSIHEKVATLTQTIDGLKVPYRGFVAQRFVQDRGKLPPLAEAELTYSYDILSPTKAGDLTGKWVGYQETFYPSLTTWETGQKGLRAAFQLYRNVHIKKADGTVEVKREDINLTTSDATFAPEAFGLGPVVPRWTATLGVAREFEGQKRILPAAMLDYRLTTKWGVSGGVVGTSGFIGGSYRFGK